MSHADCGSVEEEVRDEGLHNEDSNANRDDAIKQHVKPCSSGILVSGNHQKHAESEHSLDRELCSCDTSVDIAMDGVCLKSNHDVESIKRAESGRYKTMHPGAYDEEQLVIMKIEINKGGDM